MDSWVLVADQPRDLVARDLPHVIVSSEDYVARPYMFAGARQKIIILARSYNYQTAAYYCALLAEARGHRVMPSVETMLDLRSRAHYEHAIPELEEAFNRDLEQHEGEPPKIAVRRLRALRASGFERFSQLLFDWFRAPTLTGDLQGRTLADDPEDRADVALARCSPEQKQFFSSALKAYTGRKWRAPEAALRSPPFHRRALRSEGSACRRAT